MKIALIGIGHVDLANAILLQQSHEVVALDISAARLELLNRRQSPIVYSDIWAPRFSTHSARA